MYHRSLRRPRRRRTRPHAELRHTVEIDDDGGDCDRVRGSSSARTSPHPASNAPATTSCSGTRAAPPACPRACCGTRARCSATGSSPPTHCRTRRLRADSATRSTSWSTTSALARARHAARVAAHHSARPRDRGAPGEHRVRGRRHHRAARTRPHRRRHHLRHHRARAAERARDRRRRAHASHRDALDDADARGEPYDLSSLQRIHNSGAMVSAPLKDALLVARHDARLRLARLQRGRRLRRRAHHHGRRARDRTLPSRPERAAARRRRPRRAGRARFRRASACSRCTRRARPATTRIPSAHARPRSATIDGRLHAIPGDQAILDVDGTLTLLGRGSNCINSGGEKIWPEEVEEVLKEHPAVTDAVVLGVPDDEWGEVVAAVVATTGDDPPDADALGDWVGRPPRRLQAAAPVRVRRRGRPHHRGQARLRVGPPRPRPLTFGVAIPCMSRSYGAKTVRQQVLAHRARRLSRCPPARRSGCRATVMRSTPARCGLRREHAGGQVGAVGAHDRRLGVQRREVVERRRRAVGSRAALEEPRLHLGRARELHLTVGPVAEPPPHVARQRVRLHHVHRRTAPVRLAHRRPVGPHRAPLPGHRRHVVLAALARAARRSRAWRSPRTAAACARAPAAAGRPGSRCRRPATRPGSPPRRARGGRASPPRLPAAATNPQSSNRVGASLMPWPRTSIAEHPVLGPQRPGQRIEHPGAEPVRVEQHQRRAVTTPVEGADARARRARPPTVGVPRGSSSTGHATSDWPTLRTRWVSCAACRPQLEVACAVSSARPRSSW